jgi:hypothetical protein
MRFVQRKQLASLNWDREVHEVCQTRDNNLKANLKVMTLSHVETLESSMDPQTNYKKKRNKTRELT